MLTNFPNNIYGKGVTRVEPRPYFARDVVNKEKLRDRYIPSKTDINPYKPIPFGFSYYNFPNGYGYGNVVGNHNRTVADIADKDRRLSVYSPFSNAKYNQYT